MTDEYLRLTTHFGERLRSGSAFLSDAQMELYANRRVATSVVLRGTTGFGPRHQMRSDETLSMSEDPPAVITAVDTAEVMTALADQVVDMTPRGLVTLERLRLLEHSGPDSPDTVKLTIHLARRDHSGRQAAPRMACDLLYRHGFAGASVFLGVDGTIRGRRQRAGFFSRNTNVPVTVVAVGARVDVDNVRAELRALPGAPLVTIERAQLCKRDGVLIDRPAALPTADNRGVPLSQQLTVYTSESTLHGGAPIHRAIVRALFDSRATSGATVLRGVWGFHGDHEPHGDRVFQLSRRVPVATVIVDTPERIAACFDIVDALTARHGLVISEVVPARMTIDGGERRGTLRLARLD